MPYMPMVQLPLFFAGFFGILAVRLIMYGFARHIPRVAVAATRTVNARQFALLILNLAIVATGISISVYAIVVAAGGDTITPEELHQLIVSARSLLNWVWIIYGAVAAGVLLFLIDFLKAIGEGKNGEHQQHTEQPEKTTRPDLPRREKIIIDSRIDTADIAKMNPEQLRTVNRIVEASQASEPHPSGGSSKTHVNRDKSEARED